MEPEKKSNGALIGSIIIIIVIIIGGIYVWQSKVKTYSLEIEDVVPADTDKLNVLEQDLDTLDTNIDIDVDNLN